MDFLSLFYHIGAPLLFVFVYLYAVGTVVNIVGGIHTIVTVGALVAAGVAGGIVGLKWARIVIKGYGLVAALVLFGHYMGDTTSEGESLDSILAAHSLLEVVLVLPFVLFGFIGPLVIVIGSLIIERVSANCTVYIMVLN